MTGAPDTPLPVCGSNGCVADNRKAKSSTAHSAHKADGPPPPQAARSPRRASPVAPRTRAENALGDRQEPNLPTQEETGTVGRSPERLASPLESSTCQP